MDMKSLSKLPPELFNRALEECYLAVMTNVSDNKKRFEILSQIRQRLVQKALPNIHFYDNVSEHMYLIESCDIIYLDHAKLKSIASNFKGRPMVTSFDEWLDDSKDTMYRLMNEQFADVAYLGLESNSKHAEMYKYMIYNIYISFMLIYVMIESYYEFLAPLKEDNSNTLENRMSESILFNAWWASICNRNPIVMVDLNNDKRFYHLHPIICINEKRLVGIYNCGLKDMTEFLT